MASLTVELFGFGRLNFNVLTDHELYSQRTMPTFPYFLRTTRLPKGK